MTRRRQTEPDPGALPPSDVVVETDADRKDQQRQAARDPVAEGDLTPVEIDVSREAPVSLPEELQLDLDASEGDPQRAGESDQLVEVIERRGMVIARIHAARFSEDNVHEVRQSLLEAVPRTDRLVIEMSDVQFMSSVGIGAIMAVYKAAHQRKGRAVLAGLTPVVRSVLQATGMLRVLEVHADEQAAVDQLGDKR